MGAEAGISLAEELARHGRPTVLDMSDDRHYQHVNESWEAAGRTRAEMPCLFASLEQTRKVHQRDGGPAPAPVGPWTVTEMPIAAVTGFSFQTQGDGEIQALASALLSITGGSSYAGATLQMRNPGTHAPIGQTAVVDAFAAGIYQPIQAYGPVSSENEPVMAEFNATDSADPQALAQGAPPLRLTAQNVEVGAYPATPPVSTAPLQTKVRRVDYVMVCLLRSFGDNADCDYGPFGTTPVDVPVKGSIEYRSSVVTPFTADNAYASLRIASRKVGGGPQFELPGDQMPAFTPAGTSLSWEWKPAEFSRDNPFEAMEYVDIILAFGVTTEESPNIVHAWVTSAADAVPGPNTEKLLPLQFASGCVAEGTAVTLAGGDRRAIEDLEPGERVRGEGSVLTLLSKSSGPEPDPVVFIRTEHGNELAASGSHPVLGSHGPRRVADLHEGDVLLTETGPQRIVGLERRGSPGLVWNARLGTPEELARTGAEHGSFYAAGILVGDGTMEQALAEARPEEDQGDVLSRLPREWHEDYLATVAA